MTQPIFDGGIFSMMLIVAFACIAFYKKIGALMLLIPIIAFLIAGLVIVTGYDVAFVKTTIPTNMTITEVNGSKTTTITYHNQTPTNETDYLIGNGSFPIKGTGELWMGYSFFVLALIFAVIFLDQTLKGNLIKGD